MNSGETFIVKCSVDCKDNVQNSSIKFIKEAITKIKGKVIQRKIICYNVYVY